MKMSKPPSPGFLAVGTFVVDYQKVVDHYPDERSGAQVTRELVSNGGAPFNILINLARLQVDFPLHAAAKIGRVKTENNDSVFSPAREEEVIANVLSANKGPLPEVTVRAIYREIISGSRALQRIAKAPDARVTLDFPWERAA